MVDTPRELPENLDSFSLSRRELLMGAGAVCWADRWPRAAAPPRAPRRVAGHPAPPSAGGNFRLAVTGGGAKDIMDGQTIITKPDQARLDDRVRDAARVRHELPAPEPSGPGGHPEQARPSGRSCSRRGSSSTNGKTLTADDVVYSLNRIINSKSALFGAAGFASLKSSRHQEAQRFHDPAEPELRRCGHRPPAGAVLQRDRPRGLRGLPRSPASAPAATS